MQTVTPFLAAAFALANVVVAEDDDFFGEDAQADSSGGYLDFLDKIDLDYLASRPDLYMVEFTMILCLGFYLFQYFRGGKQNEQLMQTWWDAHGRLFQYNFAAMGAETVEAGKIAYPHNLSANRWVSWATGRENIKSMFLDWIWQARQDGAQWVIQYVTGHVPDLLKVEINLETQNIGMVCVCKKGYTDMIKKNMKDLAHAGTVYTGSEIGLSDDWDVVTESLPMAKSIITGRFADLLNENEEAIRYIHISDIFDGVTVDEAGGTIPSERKYPCIKADLYLPDSVEGQAEFVPVMEMMIDLADHYVTLKLSAGLQKDGAKLRETINREWRAATASVREAAERARKEEELKALREKARTNPKLQAELEKKEKKKQERKFKRAMKQ
eukprot:Clim_evm99s236 gene=Clim_evmTU99s236